LNRHWSSVSNGGGKVKKGKIMRWKNRTVVGREMIFMIM
jgi:hypothetical protein